MKFIDLANISVKAGDGGNGHISFRKEKYVPLGGPDGGNGGRGGNVVLVTSPHMNTLIDFKHKRHFIAENGQHGGKSLKSGRWGKDLLIKVPVGTVVKDAEDNIIADLSEKDQEFIVAKGGNGGFGNAMFTTSTNQAPRNANPGLPGAELEITLELKLLADVGLVGFPNAGKSTLISVISAAKPKIADYPFTTLIPNLGIVSLSPGNSLTVADIPGLIEGAAEGKGLGIQFLRHVERCSVLIFLISAESYDPESDYITLRDELEKYNPDMALKKRIICISKSDILDTDKIKELGKLKFGEKNTPKLLISAASSMNIDKLKYLMFDLFEQERKYLI
ncbi:MAG: GTPase ObgE [Candidatus Kapabacteria bacterium]|nr:GTPase ObgE [Ignavibacteriota bacterium]MCW5884803.1 GTPase ObgE [Candidatus Kapabacteria bacterium]